MPLNIICAGPVRDISFVSTINVSPLLVLAYIGDFKPCKRVEIIAPAVTPVPQASVSPSTPLS